MEKHKLLRHVEIDRETGCWNWTGSKTPQGYGRCFRKGTCMGAHRAMLMATGVKLQKGQHVDHLCNNRGCVNPEHLEPVAPKENMVRREKRRTHCKNGHPITEDSHYTYGGRRRCKECHRKSMRDYQRRRREETK